MLLKTYQKIKQKLSVIPEVKLLTWFNDQYEGTIHTVPAIFIEFPNELLLETLSKKNQQAPLTVRIHTVSKLISETDGSINETDIESHEAINDQVYNLLHGLVAKENDKLIFNSLARTRYLQHQYLQGWYVTTQDFEGIIYENQIEQTLTTIPKPVVNIET